MIIEFMEMHYYTFENVKSTLPIIQTFNFCKIKLYLYIEIERDMLDNISIAYYFLLLRHQFN